MENPKCPSKVLILLIGIIIGIAIPITIGDISSYVHSDMELTGKPKKFGDIKIYVQKNKYPEDIEIPEGLLPEWSKELWMTKDEVPFLLITQDKAGKVNSLFLVKRKYRPVFRMEPLSSPGKWGNATYSCVQLKEKPEGDAFKDIDFDGRFDFKLTCATDGNGISRAIFIDEHWQKIEHYSTKEMEARIGETRYTFDPNIGCWQIDE